jgi:hypothetical protein
MIDPTQFLDATTPNKVGTMDTEEFLNRTRGIIEAALQGAESNELIGMQCRLMADAEIDRQLVQLGAFHSITAVRPDADRRKVADQFREFINDTDDHEARQIAEWQVEAMDIVEMTLTGDGEII